MSVKGQKQGKYILINFDQLEIIQMPAGFVNIQGRKYGNMRARQDIWDG